MCATIERERPNVLEIVGDVLMRRIVARARRRRGARRALRHLVAPSHPQLGCDGAARHSRTRCCHAGPMHFYDSLGASEGVGFGVALDDGPGRERRPRASRSAPTRACSPTTTATSCPGSGEVGVLAVHTLVRDRLLQRSRSAARRPSARSTGTTLRHAGRLGACSTPTAPSRCSGAGPSCINTGGEKVWPEEVEEMLKEHPACVDAVVIGLPDDEWGEIVAAVVATTGAATARRRCARRVGRRDGSRATSGRGASCSSTRCDAPPSARLDYDWARAALLAD